MIWIITETRIAGSQPAGDLFVDSSIYFERGKARVCRKLGQQ